MGKTEFFVQIFGGVVRLRDAASINEQSNRNGKTAYYAFVGYDAKGRAVRRSLGQDREKAYALLAEINQRMAQGKLKDAVNAFQTATDYEIKACVKKLEGHGSTLREAVDFYLKHHRPTSGHVTFEEAGKLFVENLKRLGRSSAYVGQFETVYIPQFSKTFGRKRIVDISLDDAEKFIYEDKKGLSAYSKADYIGKMRVLFNGFAGLGYYRRELNPFQKLKKPQPSREEQRLTERDRVISTPDCAALLYHLEDSKQWDMLVFLVLQLFCGVRNQEALRLTWDEMSFEQKTVNISARIAKKRNRRIIHVPDNAIDWLKHCHEKMGGKWTLRTESGFKQKMKRVKEELREKYSGNSLYKLSFHTNFSRVSFASYGFSLFGREKTFEMMGHSRNQDLLYTNYKELVTEAQARIYFDIIPESVALKKENPIIDVRTVEHPV